MNLGPKDFAGAWRLSRELTDSMGAMSGTLEGRAAFTPRGAQQLSYAEAGTLTLDSGAVLQAERRYHWGWDGDQVVVTFEDGAPFHHFTPLGQSAGTPHLCGADLYTVAYDFTAWPRWQAVWQVTGPKKNYTSRSIYTRP